MSNCRRSTHAAKDHDVNPARCAGPFGVEALQSSGDMSTSAPVGLGEGGGGGGGGGGDLAGATTEPPGGGGA